MGVQVLVLYTGPLGKWQQIIPSLCFAPAGEGKPVYPVAFRLEADGQTGRQMDRQTDGQADRKPADGVWG